MAERSEYAPGTPSWVDLGSPDKAAAAAFYGGLFGWTIDTDPRPEAGGYGLFKLNGKVVAGLGDQTNMDMPPYWAVSVSVADAADTLAKVTAAGGRVVMGPMAVLDAGTLGVIQDPGGSFLSIWQPDQHKGAEVVNEPGAFGWNELATSDLAAARAFYQAVFGWGLMEQGSSDQAAIFTIDGRLVCGAHAASEHEQPAWSVWFGVDDCDASAAKVAELGGSVLMPPNDMDFGRGAVVADPQGATFGIGAVKPGIEGADL